MSFWRWARKTVDRVQDAFYRYCGRNYQCGCGHTTKWKTALTVHGHPGIFTAPNKRPEYCVQCWINAAIKCAWCGETILPGDPITLYTPTDPAFEIPEHAVVYRREPSLQLVGCLGWDCAETGAHRAGFWMMPGKVQRVASPLEQLFAQGATGPVICSDLSDPRQALPLDDTDSRAAIG